MLMKPPVRLKLLLWGAALFLAAWAAPADASAARPAASIAALEDLVSRWIELKTAIASENREWRVDRERLETELNLLEKEKLLLKEEIAAARLERDSRAGESAALASRKEELEKVLERTVPALAGAEGVLADLREIIPPPALPPLEPLYDRLRRSGEEPVSRRLQAILGLFGEIEGLHGSIRVSREVLALTAGRRREFDVIYLGLARGFAVSDDSSEAGIGEVTAGGWDWRRADAAARQIRSVVDSFRRDRPPVLIELPLRLGPERP